MGEIKEILLKESVPVPRFNNRFTVELCENVHIHYRNLRLEFGKDEFLFILRLLKTLNEKDIESFNFAPDKFMYLVSTFDLPENTEFNSRLQIEEQVEGHFHIHYRNLRIELNNLTEMGLKNELRSNN